MKKLTVVLLLFIISYGCPVASAQQENIDAGDVIMVEQEILIQVAPELPTVIIAIPRQKPDIEPVTIQNPLERMIKPEFDQIKPDLSSMKVSKIEEHEKMLAKRR